ncbi:MAG: methyltransferase domain-containing protein [bacterium]
MPIKSTLKKIIPKKYHSQAQKFCFKFKSFWYFGNKVICPCCNGSFRKFLSFGIKSRPNAQCPKCESLERHRLFWIYLRDKTDFFKGNLKVLDIAPVKFLQKKFKAITNLDYVSADISSPLAMLKIDITDIQLPDNQFDCIFCYHVLEHILDDQKAMRELFRVLKHGGWAILQSPIDNEREKSFENPNIVSPKERERVFGQSDHVRIYGKDYKDRLEKAGFAVKLDNYAMELGDDAIKKYGLMKDEIIYFCAKSKADLP